MPWPRELRIHSDITKELCEDVRACEWYIENIPDRWLAEHGLKRAPGAEWESTWRQYDQKDLDHHNAFYFAMDVKPSFEVGDWHYQAITWVVKDE